MLAKHYRNVQNAYNFLKNKVEFLQMTSDFNWNLWALSCFISFYAYTQSLGII